MKLRDHKKLHLIVLFTVLLSVAVYFQSSNIVNLTKAAGVASSPTPTTMPNITLSYDRATPTPIVLESDLIGSEQASAEELALNTKGEATISATDTIIDHDKELPETGLPLAAAALVGLLPVGMSLRKFIRNYQSLVDRPNYLWQKRDFAKEDFWV